MGAGWQRWWQAPLDAAEAASREDFARVSDVWGGYRSTRPANEDPITFRLDAVLESAFQRLEAEAHQPTVVRRPHRCRSAPQR